MRTRWEEIKAQERGGSAKPKTLLSGIAPALPALLRAYHIGTRAASVGFDWDTTRDVVAKIQEEVDELREVVEAPAPIDQARAEEEMGDLLFSIAKLSRRLGIEPETALRKANDKFTKRFGRLEQSVERLGTRDEGHDARRARGGVAAAEDGAQLNQDLRTTKTRRTHEDDTKTRSQDLPPQTILQYRHVEVHQQADAQAGSACSSAAERDGSGEMLDRLEFETIVRRRRGRDAASQSSSPR